MSDKCECECDDDDVCATFFLPVLVLLVRVAEVLLGVLLLGVLVDLELGVTVADDDNDSNLEWGVVVVEVVVPGVVVVLVIGRSGLGGVRRAAFSLETGDFFGVTKDGTAMDGVDLAYGLMIFLPLTLTLTLPLTTVIVVTAGGDCW